MDKVGLFQVATCLSYANPGLGLWTLLDAELFVPEAWFSHAAAERRQQVGPPPERVFETKTALGLKMIRRVQAVGVPLERVACDELYGRGQAFRASLDSWGIRYAAQVQLNTQVHVSEPRVGVPRRKPGRSAPTRLKVLSRAQPQEVRALAGHSQTAWRPVRVRPTERGELEADFAVGRIRTVAVKQPARAEWLVMRRAADGDIHLTVLNDPADTPAALLIEASCLRCGTERTFEDAKSDLGWDEFQAQKYRAREHHLALIALAS